MYVESLTRVGLLLLFLSQRRLISHAPTDTMFSQTTTSTSNNFPSTLRSKLTSNTQNITSKDIETNARIARDCPKCPAKEMTWSEAQLRSADEGTTIFYRCPSCGYR